MSMLLALALLACEGERADFSPGETTTEVHDAGSDDDSTRDARPPTNQAIEAGNDEAPNDDDGPRPSDASTEGDSDPLPQQTVDSGGGEGTNTDDGADTDGADDSLETDGTQDAGDNVQTDDTDQTDDTSAQTPSAEAGLDDHESEPDAGEATPVLLSVELELSDDTLTTLGAVSYQVSCTYAGSVQSQDCTSEASIDASNPSMVSIGTGAITVLSAGSTDLVATLDDVESNSVTLNVDLETPNELIEITVSAPEPELAVGLSQSLTAECEYQDETVDCTETVTWHTSTPTVATVDESGVVSAVLQGTTLLSASLDGIDSNSVSMLVTPAVVTSITLTPSGTASIEIGTSRPFEANCIWSDDSASDCSASVEWTSSAPNIVSLDSGGGAFGVDTGTSIVSAQLSGVSSSNLTVTVVPPPGCEDIIDFPDEVLETDIREQIGKTSGAIYYADVKSLTFFQHLTINGNIADLTGLRCLTGLTELNLEESSFTDISEIVGLTRLTDLNLRWSSVASVPNLSAMTELTNLNLTGTSITNLFDLVETTSLGDGDTVNVQNTNIDCEDSWIIGQIEELMDRGVTVYHLCTL